MMPIATRVGIYSAISRTCAVAVTARCFGTETYRREQAHVNTNELSDSTATRTTITGVTTPLLSARV